VLVPQVSAAWGHEYAGGARTVDAEYVDSSPSPVFKFNREKVARDWAMIGVGAVGQLENGLQPFASFTTMQGNANFTSYGATIGLRIAF
jgi:outer membrane autotransporter protein